MKNGEKMPNLFECVKKFNIIPDSSVPEEVSFSVAKYIERKEQSRLDPKTLEQSMVVRQMDLLNEFLDNL